MDNNTEEDYCKILKNLIRSSSQHIEHILHILYANGGNREENDAIWKLRNVRNPLFHSNSNTITQSEYNAKVNTFKKCMLRLGMEESKIERLIQRAQVTSSLKAYERVQVLFEKAEKLWKDDKVDEALEQYSEAIQTPCLLQVNLREIYERRADCYLKSMKNPFVEDEYSNLAFSDVTQALELNSESWTANYLAGKYYRIKNNMTKAIEYYETALSISPAQKQVQNDLDTCRFLDGVLPKYAKLCPRLVSDKLAQNYKMDDPVWRGHQCTKAKDYTRAVGFYTKADKQGNMEASYHLAECYYFGYGVQKDVKKGFEIFKRVAEMNIKKQKGVLNKAVISGEAQYATGLCYENGTGVEKDIPKAALWYEKAMGKGKNGRAANNLGILYSNGYDDLKKDEKTAADCWKRGVDLEDGNSAECLVGYYCNQLEREMAKSFLEVGRKLKNQTLLLLTDKEFNRKMLKVVTDFEDRNNLNSNGFTFKQRVDRAKTGTHLKPSSENIKIETQDAAQIKPGDAKQCDNWEDSYERFNGTKITQLNQMQMGGSQEALRILELILNNSKMNRSLKERANMDVLEENGNSLKKLELELQLIDLLYECATTAIYFVVFISDEERQQLEKIVLDLFNAKQAHNKEISMKIRFCYLRLNLWTSLTSAGDTLALELLKDGLVQHPEHPNKQHYYELLITVFGYRQLWNEGISCSDEALVKFPENEEIMYFRAVHVRSSNADPLEVIEAYTKFVKCAPEKHRKLPEAYYQISYGYIKQLEKCGDKGMVNLIESHFQNGQECEKVQLPCYLPYHESDAKANVAKFLKKRLNKKPQPKLLLEASEQKKCLQSSTRRKHIKEHRKIINQLKKDPSLKTDLFTNEPKQQFLLKKMSSVKPITLSEMKCSEDTIFDNRVIYLTVIDDPIPLTKSIYLVVEDDDKDTTPLYLKNIEVNQENLEEYQPGCRIGVVNPYLWFDDQTKLHGLRSASDDRIMYLKKREDICRFCGKGNATHRCSNCKRPYCSKECRDLDICSTN